MKKRLMAVTKPLMAAVIAFSSCTPIIRSASYYQKFFERIEKKVENIIKEAKQEEKNNHGKAGLLYIEAFRLSIGATPNDSKYGWLLKRAEELAESCIRIGRIKDAKIIYTNLGMNEKASKL